MARIEQVIHVKYDGEVRECALFDSASDIPSPATAREFALNGAAIYGAVLDGGATLDDDAAFLLGESGTELAFHDGPDEYRLLTTPYFVRPKTESLEFGADGGTVYLEPYSSTAETHEDILSTNGTYAGYSCDYDGISVVNEGTIRSPQYAVVCAANTSAEDISFTLVLTFSFADGSTRNITFTGTQAAAEEKEAWLRVDPDSLSFGADGGSAQVEVDSSTSDFSVDGISGIWLSVRKAATMGGERSLEVTAASNTATSARSGSVTLSNGDGCAAEIAVTQEGASSGGGGGTGDTRTLTLDITTAGAGIVGSGIGPSVRLTCDGVSSSHVCVSTGTNSWTCSASFADGSEVSYEVSMDGYATVTGSVTMDQDRTVSVRLRIS